MGGAVAAQTTKRDAIVLPYKKAVGAVSSCSLPSGVPEGGVWEARAIGGGLKGGENSFLLWG